MRRTRRCLGGATVVAALAVVWMIGAGFPGAGCTSAPGARRGLSREMVMLTGTWQKLSTIPCSRVYPEVIEFRTGGLYSSRGAQPGDVPGWDAGTWEILSATRARISTVNDAKLMYDFSIEDGVLTFVDQQGCKFQYRKIG